MNYKIMKKKCSEWTIPELKKALGRRKEKLSGKKQDLCDRLRESLKHPIDKSKTKNKEKITSKKQASMKLKPISRSNGEFIFYISMYYQMPNSKMPIEYLTKYGLTKKILDKYNTYEQFLNSLT